MVTLQSAESVLNRLLDVVNDKLNARLIRFGKSIIHRGCLGQEVRKLAPSASTAE